MGNGLKRISGQKNFRPILNVGITLTLVFSFGVSATLNNQNYFVAAYRSQTNYREHQFFKMESMSILPVDFRRVNENTLVFEQPVATLVGLGLGPDFLVVGAHIAIVQIYNLSLVRATDAYKSHYIQHIVCIDASTCIAADENMNGTGYWKLSNFLQGAEMNEATDYVSISPDGRERYIGIANTSTLGPTFVLCTKDKCHMVYLDTQNDPDKYEIAIDWGQKSMATYDEVGPLIIYLNDGGSKLINFFNFNDDFTTTSTTTVNADFSEVYDFRVFEQGRFLVSTSNEGVHFYEKKPCHTSCATCDGPSEVNCRTCPAGAAVTSGSCGGCPVGTVLNNSICVACGPNCETCESVKPTECITCNSSFYFDLVDRVCTSCLTPGYAIVNSLCLACVPPCKTCQTDASFCTSCIDAFYLQGSICLHCDLSCATCTDSSTCVTCPVNMYIQESNGKCGPCGTGYFLDNFNVCRMCHPGCQACSGYYPNCTTCQTGLTKFSDNSCCSAECTNCTNGTCYNCASGYYRVGGSSGICSPCATNCNICNGTSNCTTCAAGYTVLSGYCVACTADCKNCSSGTCTECYSPKKLLDNFSCGLCGIGNFSNATHCSRCTNGCETCINIATNCTSCNSTSYLNGGNTCVACPANCTSCTSPANCTACGTGYHINFNTNLCSVCPVNNSWFISGTTCYPCSPGCQTCTLLPNNCNSCLTGYYQSGLSCNACPTSCSACSSATICTACTGALKFFPSNYSCGTCPFMDGWYISGSECLQCNPGCGSCSFSASNCDTCMPGYYDGGNSNCLPCLAGCTNCTSNTNCNACSGGNYFFPNNSTCGPCATANGWYINGSSCLQCDLNCTSCSTSATFCNNCATGFVAIIGVCQPSTCSAHCTTCTSSSLCTVCADGHYLNGSNCHGCWATCKKCTNSTGTCSECDIDMYRMPAPQYGCDVCGAGNYISGIDCLPCGSTCGNCSGSAATCTSCRSGFYFNAGTCIPCPSTCSECTSSTSCSVCAPGNDLYINNTCAQCQTWTNWFKDGQYCRECDTSCLTCTGSATTCSSCTARKYLSGGQCLNCSSNCAACNSNTDCYTCDLGYTPVSGACTASLNCPTNCANCSNPSVCDQCQNGFYLSSGSCFNCHSSCTTCNNSLSCLDCNASQYIYANGLCGTCGLGNYTQGNNCLPCNSNCTACNSYTSCTACRSSHFLNGGICQACDVSCGTCNNLVNCTGCVNGTFLSMGGACLASCPTGFFGNNSTCIACDASCASCSNSSTNCTACANGTFLSMGSCVVTCPTGFFGNNTTCSPCNGSCASCSNTSTNCTDCTNGTFLLMGACLTSCPPNYYGSNSTCRVCNAPCASCSNSSTNCTGCSNNMYLFNGTCTSSCPGGYYSINNTCSLCDSSCQNCSVSSTACTSCGAGKTLVNGLCQNPSSGSGSCEPNCLSCVSGVCSVCQNKFFMDGGNCNPCEASCASCTNATQCTTCDTTAGLCKNRTSSLCVSCSLLTGYANISAVEVPAELRPKSAHFAANVSLLQPKNPSEALKAALLLGIRLKARFFQAVGMKEEVLQTKSELTSQGTATMALVDYLETDKYKLVFRSDVSTFVEFEDTVYEILPYNFTFDFDNPRSSKQQVEVAIKQGEMAAGLITAGVPTASPAAADMLMTAVSVDPTGLTTKASQMVKIFNRLFYVNVFFGDRLNVFLSEIEKVSATKRSPSQGSYIRQIGSSGWKARLSEKKVSGDFLNDFNWKIWLYLFSWTLQLVAWLIARLSLKMPVLALIVLYWIPKMRLIVMNMVLVDFGFYATHAAMHFNYFPSSQLAMLCLTLIVLDILEMVDIALKMTAWLKFYETNIVPKKLPSFTTQATTSAKVFPEEKKILKKLKSKKNVRGKKSELANINNPASSEQASTGNQPNTVKEIDYIRTYACIGYNFHLVAMMSASLALDSSAFNSSARLLLLVHTCRVLAYQVLIVSCQSAPVIVILGLAIIEIAKTTFALKTDLGKRVLASRLVLISEISQSIFLFGFLSLCAYLIFSNQATVSESIQTMGVYLIIGAVCTEYVLLAANVIRQVLNLVMNYRETQKMKRENPELYATRKKGPGMKWFIMYRTRVLEPAVEAPTGKKTKETSLNTPDSALHNFKRDFRRNKLLSVFDELHTSGATVEVGDDSFSALKTGVHSKVSSIKTESKLTGQLSKKSTLIFTQRSRDQNSAHRDLKTDQYPSQNSTKIIKRVKKESATHIIDRSGGPTANNEGGALKEIKTKNLFKRRLMLL